MPLRPALLFVALFPAALGLLATPHTYTHTYHNHGSKCTSGGANTHTYRGLTVCQGMIGKALLLDLGFLAVTSHWLLHLHNSAPSVPATSQSPDPNLNPNPNPTQIPITNSNPKSDPIVNINPNPVPNPDPILDTHLHTTPDPILDTHTHPSSDPILSVNPNPNPNPSLILDTAINSNPTLDTHTHINPDPILNINSNPNPNPNIELVIEEESTNDRNPNSEAHSHLPDVQHLASTSEPTHTHTHTNEETLSLIKPTHIHTPDITQAAHTHTHTYTRVHESEAVHTDTNVKSTPPKTVIPPTKKSELLAAIQTRTGLPKSKVQVILSAMLESITDEVLQGRKVYIPDLGVFSLRTRAAYTGRNPRTGEEVPVNGKRFVSFNPSKSSKTVSSDSD